jgi:3-(3-hydroxy-phenyl)propionate hydroxylase
LLDSYSAERHEAAQQNVLVTNRTARFLRPADGAERLFRTAALGLARQHLFARQLVNTGRMSVPNTYSRSAVCDKTGGMATQNVSFSWANGQPGELVDLLSWAGGQLLLLVFGALPASAASRLRELAGQSGLRCVQVLAPGEQPQAREHVIDQQGHLRATCCVAAATAGGWALLRPDSYVAATGQRLDAGLVRAVSAAIGLQEENA